MATTSSSLSSRVVILTALCFFATGPPFFSPVITVVDASGFLKAPPSSMLNEANVVSELEQALREALGHGHGQADEAKMQKRRAVINPMFESMPKLFGGGTAASGAQTVGREAVQYMVHRYFGVAHGWTIRGFEPSAAGPKNASRTAESGAVGANKEILREKLPSYVGAALESRLENGGRGFTAQDVVVMATVLERMIMDESVEMLESAYHLNGVDDQLSGGMLETMVNEVMESFMMIYALRAQRTNQTFHAMVKDYMHTVRNPDGWRPAMFGYAQAKTVMKRLEQQNPFRAKTYSMEDTLQAVHLATEGYGRWTNQEECRALKEGLIPFDREQNGRVRLVDFYAIQTIGTTWHLDESMEYLRSQGVLDESSKAKGPRVIIPNYVQSLANCVAVSGFYSACCLRECEPIMGEIEAAVREPEATPARLLPIVQGLVDDHEEDGPRNLTGQLKAQLDKVAEQNRNGRVPLHGRLFQQWLHYVFPHECPYPFLREAVQMETSKEWEEATGIDRRISPEIFEQVLEIKKKVDDIEANGTAAAREAGLADEFFAKGGSGPDGAKDLSHWSMEEELYVVSADPRHHPRRLTREAELEESAEGDDLGGHMLSGLMRSGVLLGGIATLVLMLGKVLTRRQEVVGKGLLLTASPSFGSGTMTGFPGTTKINAWV